MGSVREPGPGPARPGAPRHHIVQLNRFFTDVEADQDVVNRVQNEFFAGHLPTSTSVEVK